MSLLLAFAVLLSALPSRAERLFDACPPEGDATERGRADPALNELKNREDAPPKYEPIAISDILALPVPDGIYRAHRRRWPASAKGVVDPHERRTVVAEGYLLKAKLEGGESTNCHELEERDRDFHMWLAESSRAKRPQSVVVEITPRLRARHPGWKLKNIDKLIHQKARMRISGWLMLDPEHPDQVGKTRGTVWEIHPVTRIEVFSGGRWVEL